MVDTLIEEKIESGTEHLPAPRKFTVEEYYRMGEAGVFQPGERVELIEGVILRMSPKGTRHAASTTCAAVYFIKTLGDQVVVRIQDPIDIGRHSEPEPDIVLAVPQEKKYFDHHPLPSEILLVLEIADTTIPYDRVKKGRIYARAGIAQYLILNVNTRELEDYTDPDEDGYRARQTYRADQSFTLLAFPDIAVAVHELLPPE